MAFPPTQQFVGRGPVTTAGRPSDQLATLLSAYSNNPILLRLVAACEASHS